MQTLTHVYAHNWGKEKLRHWWQKKEMGETVWKCIQKNISTMNKQTYSLECTRETFDLEQ